MEDVTAPLRLLVAPLPLRVISCWPLTSHVLWPPLHSCLSVSIDFHSLVNLVTRQRNKYRDGWFTWPSRSLLFCFGSRAGEEREKSGRRGGHVSLLKGGETIKKPREWKRKRREREGRKRKGIMYKSIRRKTCPINAFIKSSSLDKWNFFNLILSTLFYMESTVKCYKSNNRDQISLNHPSRSDLVSQ